MTDYINVFGSTTTPPSEYGYDAVTLTANTTAFWPFNYSGTGVTIAKVNDITPAGYVLTLPDATEVSPGEDFILNNVGAGDLVVKDNGGSTIATIAAGISEYFVLRTNTTAAGTWGLIVFGAGAATTAVAASLLGNGHRANTVDSTKMDNILLTNSINSGYTIAETDNATALVYTDGTATLALPVSSSLYNGYHFWFTNEGSGTVTINPFGTETIDTATTKDIQPGESCVIATDAAGAWYTIGYGKSNTYVWTQLSVDLSSNSSYTDAPTNSAITVTSAQAANKLWNFTNSPITNVTVTIPAVASVYFVRVGAAGAYTLTFTAGGTSVALTANTATIIYCDGTDVLNAQTVTVASSVSLADGTAASPSLFFTLDVDTGLYRVGSNVLGVATGGVTRGNFGTNGWTGKVQGIIGDVTPAAGTFTTLAATEALTVGTNITQTSGKYTASYGINDFATHLTSTFQGSGPQTATYYNPAIPANDPAAIHYIYAANSTPAKTQFGEWRYTITDKTSGSEDANYTVKVQLAGALTTAMTLTGDTATFPGNLAVDTNTMYVDASNNRVGVGTATPSVELDVTGTGTKQISCASTDNVTNGIGVVNAFANVTIRTAIQTHAPARVATRYGRTVGGYGELISEGTGAAGLLIGTGTTATPIVFGTNSTERARIDSDGTIGIGIAPVASTKLTISQTSASGNNVTYLKSAASGQTDQYFGTYVSNGGTDNEFVIRNDGNAYCDGAWNGGGADYAEYFEWLDGNPLNEDRRGLTVVLVGELIRPAVQGETPFGVISGNPSVVGDAAWNMWKGKYELDDYGSYLMEDAERWEWTEIVEVAVTEQVQATVEEPVVRYEIQEVNGQWQRLTLNDVKLVPQFTEHPLFDAYGEPVMELVNPAVEEVLDEDGEIITPATPATYAKAIHRVPVMVDVEKLEERKTEHSYWMDQIPAGVVVPADKTVKQETRRKLNPAYDPAEEYTPREFRKEWDCVGFVGKLRIRKGQVVNPAWQKMRDVSATVEEWFIK